MLFRQLISKARYGGLFNKNALFKAVKTGNMHSTDHLLTKANVNNQDENGNTALHYAVKYNRLSIAKILLEWGADTNIANNNGMAPLTISTIQNDSDCMKLLLENNAKITNADLYYAMRGNNIYNLHTLLTNQQVHLSPNMSSNLKKLDSNVNFFRQVIKDHLFKHDIDSPLYCNVADMDNNVAPLLGVTEE
ncbi:ankyrin repeat domain-containing protein [Candidatus Tisiphia endosymbiont of Oplodontha viridula]|uniref:ankyrin repeat domain-containing protein n=1 Tax=Candidatus Tisiphia endosymbiont of Oplodontha viridula TaxID=3077925 RepID=UPI0035C8BB08